MRPIILAIAFLISVASTAWGQSDLRDVDRGHALAKSTCIACHWIEKKETAEKFMDVPSFQTIANNPARTKLALLVFLKSPHANMPDIVMSEEEIDNVIAYIMSLKAGAD